MITEEELKLIRNALVAADALIHHEGMLNIIAHSQIDEALSFFKRENIK